MEVQVRIQAAAEALDHRDRPRAAVSNPALARGLDIGVYQHARVHPEHGQAQLVVPGESVA
jgi:hypothetical protein